MAEVCLQRWGRCAGLLLLFSFSFAYARAAEEDGPQSGQQVPVTVQPSGNAAELGLPPFDYPIEDGLYATVTALNGLEIPELKNETKVKLKKVEGAKKELEVRVHWQDRPAPLVVALMGLATRSKDPLARYWQNTLYQSGFHVLSFDSIFLPTFSERSRHGVAGNLRVEAQLVGNLLDAFLKETKSHERVTKVGVIGSSYGATLALNMAILSKEGKLPAPVDRFLAFSPPVSMKTAAWLLDKFHREDRWNYSLVELAGDLLGHKPVPPGTPIPFEPAQMRAGIAAAFRMDLMDVVDRDDALYKLKLIPAPDQFDDQYRRDVAESWNFTRFMEEMSLPYWQREGKVADVASMWAMGDLAVLLPACPDNAHVILAANDPLNDATELEHLRSAAKPAQLTILPRGGHMGYINSNWAKARAAKMFE